MLSGTELKDPEAFSASSPESFNKNALASSLPPDGVEVNTARPDLELEDEIVDADW